MKIHSEGAELFPVKGRTDRQTDMTKLIINFHNYANAPRNNEQKYNCADLK
jgi:hypothetical protein